MEGSERGGALQCVTKKRNSTAVLVEMRSKLYDIWVTESGANKGTLLSLLIFRGEGGASGTVHVQ